MKIRSLPFEATGCSVRAVLELAFALAACGQVERCRFYFLWALEAQVLLRCICLLVNHWHRCILHRSPASPEVRESLAESRCILGPPALVVLVVHAPHQHACARNQRIVFLLLASFCALALLAAGPGCIEAWSLTRALLFSRARSCLAYDSWVAAVWAAQC